MAGSLIGAQSRKTGAALVSIASNSVLILLKVVAGVLTGSVALITEALQSAVDLVASVVAFISIRKSEEPPDPEHPFGHAKFENLAAAFEGILILVGAGIIVFESSRRLVEGSSVQRLGIGMAILAVTIVINLVVSSFLARRARETGSPALEGDAAHLRTDAITSVGVLGGLALVEITGETWLDPAVALLVAMAIVLTGIRLVNRSSRVLVDEGLPGDELAIIRQEIVAFGPRGVAGFHKLRARRAGTRRHVDMHVQFRAGTSLEDAHATAHALQAAIEKRLQEADILIHMEPEDRVVPGTEIPAEPGAGAPTAG